MPRKNNSELTKQKIIEVATEIFMQKGYENTTMQDIVKGVSMSSGAIFYHFKSKKEILDDVIKANEAWMTKLFHGWLEELAVLTAKEKLISILDKQLDVLAETAVETTYAQLNQSPQMVVSQMVSNVNHNAKYVAELFREGVTDGSLTTENPDACAQVFMLLYNHWTDLSVFHCELDEIKNRMEYLQSLMRNMGADIITDENIERNMELMKSNLSVSR